jgi:DNA-binding beta-propeller fold protein YncE
MTSRLLVAITCGLLLAGSGVASTQKSPTVSLASRPSGLVAGRPWNAVLVVRGFRPARVAVTATSGRRRVAVSVRRWRKERYRGRLVFPAAGRWSLTALVGGKRFRLGALLVRARAPVPLQLVYPTAAVLDQGGSLLVVETGSSAGIVRIDPATGREASVARLARPFGVVRAPSGALYASDGNRVLRIDRGGSTTTVAEAASDVGPLTVDGAGNVYFTTATQIFRIPGGSGAATHIAGSGVEGGGGDRGPALAAEFHAPHGLAIGADGALYVSDTGNNRIRRIDLSTGVIDAFAAAEGLQG